jgi:glycosyltransferase involved in cell wall biosynthesis
MIKVVHLISSLETGGTEMMLFKLLAAANKDEFNNSVISLTKGGAIAERIAGLGVPVENLGMSRSAPSPVGMLRLYRALRRERPDVLQTWLYHSDLLGYFAGKLANVPALAWNIRCSTTDDRYFTGMTGRVVRMLARLSAKPDAVIVNSDAGRTIHEGLGYKPRRWDVIPNGFDLTRFRPDSAARSAVRNELGIPSDAAVIGLVARFDPLKGHGTFLRAAAQLLGSNPSTHFVLVGAGVESNNPFLSDLIDELGISSQVHLMGERSDAARITATFDIATCSSTGEGFPNIIGEAMASGVPVVTTDVGDARLIVGDTGVVVPLANPKALAKGWQDVLDLGAEGITALGERARARVSDHYDIDGVAEQYATIYRNLASKRAPIPD